MKRSATVLAAYACIGAVYLIYLPHALPVMDDWSYLERFEQARAPGWLHSLAYLRSLIDNSWLLQFRILWASALPVYALSFLAGFAGWPYCLLAWMAHLATGALLGHTVSLLTGDRETGFSAGAVYVVFPAANTALLWPVSNSVYYLESLALIGWLYYTWKKLTVEADYRYRARDAALLLLATFSGEQILPALALLPLATWWLFGSRERHGAFLRLWAKQAATMAAAVAFYALAINRMPIVRGFQNRYHTGLAWSLRPFSFSLFSALGWDTQTAGWRASWRPGLVLVVLAALAAIAFFGGLRGRLRAGAPQGPARERLGELLLWSVAGVILTYLPLARLTTFEWRYLYVLSLFLVPAGIALLALLPRPARLVLTFLAVVYGLGQTYFEIRQCWIPQSRIAREIIDTVQAAGPVASHEVFIFSGTPYTTGIAPSFLTGASWPMGAMLEHYTKADHVPGARDLVINEHSELALHFRDGFVPFHRQDLHRVRVYLLAPDGRFVPRSVAALPTADGRWELFALRSFSGGPLPAGPLALEDLQRSSLFQEIYFPRRASTHEQALGL